MHMARATVQIPDTKLAKEAHDILREFSTTTPTASFSLLPSKVGRGRSPSIPSSFT
jgi:hypothetical protein